MKIFSLFFLLFVSLTTTQTFAATFTVTTNTDTGTGSLRAAVASANAAVGDDIIIFSAGITTVTLASEIIITNNGALTIVGKGANALTIDGGPGTNRIFTVTGATVTIIDVTLSGGNGTGAAVFADGGTLILDTVVVQNNAGNDNAGAINLNGGTNHRIANTTISGNTGFVFCAAIYAFGSPLTVVNTTVSGNTMTSEIGAICVLQTTATFRNTTISGNTASGTGGAGGGGIFIQDSSTVNLGNTIVAGNSSGGSGPDLHILDGTSIFTTSGGNLIGDNSGGANPNTTAFPTSNPTGNPNVNGDKVGTTGSTINPMLDTLQINGGTTPTRALMTGSPAINAGVNALATAADLTTDQRGAGFARIVGAAVDTGAFEVQLGATAAAVGVGGRVTTAKGIGIQNVIVTMTDSEGNIRITHSTSLGYYRFDSVTAGETYVLSARGKRYNFTEQTQVRSINEETNDVDFIGYSERVFR